MNYIDLVLGLLLLFAAFRGFSNGFVAEVASLLALVLGIWGAIHFSHLMTGFIIDTFDYQPKYLGLISFLITFVIIVVIIYLIGKAVETLLYAIALGFLNKLAGILFGVIKSALILSVLLLIFEEFDEDAHILPKDVKAESQMYEPVKNLVPTVLPFLNIWNVNEIPFKKEKEQTNEPGKKV
jgi:membrane protein required for colicin V production